jgi:CubicO group peptidase (beta-lactamase class C family)
VRGIIRPALAGALLILTGCAGPSEPDARAAEAAYVDCAAQLGVTVASVEIGRDTFDVQLADDAPSHAAETLRARCEPMALAMRDDPAPATTLPEVPDGISSIDGYVAHLEDQRFAGALLVARDGDVVVRRALGLADRGTGTPNTAGTAFDIGSISKTFTAAAVLRLVDDGELGLDDTLGDLLTDVPADKRAVTIGQLLDFTSGLGEYHDTEGDFEAMSRDEALRRILDQELLFEPGTDSAYSNSSYTLAAIVVEQVTGRDFTAEVGDLFAEAGLRDTGFYGSPVLGGTPVATGYRGETHGRNNPASWEPTWALLGAGGIVSTVDDLHRWWNLLGVPGLLRPETTRVVRDHLPVSTVGGLELRGVGGTNDFGFDASILELPGRGTVIVVVSNANPPDRSIATDTSAVLAQLAGH